MNARLLPASAALALSILAGGCMQDGKTWYGQNKDDSSNTSRSSNDYNSSRNYNSTDRSSMNPSDMDEISRVTQAVPPTGSSRYYSSGTTSGNWDDQARPNRDNNSRTNDTDANAGASWTADTVDAQILMVLHSKNREEVAAGKLAQDRSENSQVRDYGKMLAKHHGENDDMVKKHAKRLGVELDTKADDSAKRMINREFASLEGSDFDQQFAAKMRDGHRDMIRKVESAQANAQDAQVKQFLAETLTTLRQHEQTAARLAGGNTSQETSERTTSMDR